MAQIVSCEIILALASVPVVILSGSLNINSIVFMQQESCWYIFPLFPIMFVFYVASLIETNRSPFDVPEAESELVAGFRLEYSNLTSW